MKRVLGILFVLFMLFSCAHGRSGNHDTRSMYYGNSVDAVFAASETVLKEEEYDIIETNRHDNLIKARKATGIPGMRLTVTFTFREEGSGTWLEIIKDVPMQLVPGSTDSYRMDVNELFRLVELELDRNY